MSEFQSYGFLCLYGPCVELMEDLIIKYPQVSRPHFPDNLAHSTRPIVPLGLLLCECTLLSVNLCVQIPSAISYPHFLFSENSSHREGSSELIPSVSFNTHTHTDVHIKNAQAHTQSQEFYSQI